MKKDSLIQSAIKGRGAIVILCVIVLGYSLYQSGGDIAKAKEVAQSLIGLGTISAIGVIAAWSKINEALKSAKGDRP